MAQAASKVLGAGPGAKLTQTPRDWRGRRALRGFPEGGGERVGGKGEAKGRVPANFYRVEVCFAVATPLRAELCLACAASGKSAPVISLGASHGT